MLGGRLKSVDQVDLRQKDNWKKRSGNTQKRSNVIGNKSKGTNCHISYTKRERPANCMHAVRECGKDEKNDYAMVQKENKQQTRTQNEQ